VQCEIFRFLEEPHAFRMIAGKFQQMPASLLRLFLERLVRGKLVYHQRRTDKYLAVAVRCYASRTEYLAEMESAIELLQPISALSLRVS